MADEQGPIFGFGFEGDDESARRESDRMTKILTDSIAGALQKSAPKIGQALAKALGKGGQAYRDFGDEAKRSQEKSSAAVKELIDDQEALTKRIAATRAQLEKVGASPDLFAVIDRELAKVQSSFRAFNGDIERIVDNPDLLDGYEIAFRNAQQTIFREVAGIQSQLRNLSQIQRIEGNQANEIVSRQLQERLATQRAANSRYVVETQGANAQVLAETRIAGQRQVVQDRANARSRIELVRFTFQQIRVLERGIAAAFRGTASIIESTIRTLQRGAGRIGNLFRRTNADLNEGLGGALIQRERTISRSFNRQERIIRESVAQQSVTIQRFEAQASTGIAGAVSGRSSLGALLGGGLAVGGGVGIFQGIRNQLDVGGDFVQGLAVLQAQLKLTDEEMANVRQQSIDLGNDISLPGVSALDAAQAIQILAKQFASFGSDALPAAQGAARGVLQLSRAMGVQADEAARVVGAAVNVFGAAASDAVAIADQVTNAMSLAAGVGFNDFADAFTQSASVVNLFIGPAQDATDSLAELNAAVATLAKGGLIGSDAGTSIKQFFLQANRGTVDSVEVMNELVARAGETGTAFFDAAGSARTFSEAIDILSRGTRNLNDQARAQVLQKLFGSDAARAAGILLNEGAAAFERLEEAVKEQGTAARIAAAQNTGLRGALDALQSVIETQQIKTYERYQKQLGNVILVFAELLNNFFEGVGVMGVIRNALIGVGAALGALLAAKAAGEAIQFLTIALGGLISPLGIIVGGLALLGAAIGALSAISPEFRVEMGKIRDDLKTRFGDALEFIAGQLGDLAGFLRTEALPPFISFAVGVARRVIPVIKAAADQVTLLADSFRAGFSGEGLTTEGLIGFAERLGIVTRQIKESVKEFGRGVRGQTLSEDLGELGKGIPEFANKLGLLVDSFQDAFSGEGITSTGLVGFAERLGVTAKQIQLGATEFVAGVRGLEQATDLGELGQGLPDFAFRVGQTLRSVVAQVGEIIAAVVDVFQGERTIASIASAVGSWFANIGRDIWAKLGPQLDSLLNLVGDFIDNAGSSAGGRIGSAAQSFLLGPFQSAVAALGFFLGNLATDPRLVLALEKLIGLAILTGANFVKGLIRGIGDNIDELGSMFAGQLTAAIELGLSRALNPRAIAGFIVSGLGAAVIGAALVASLRRPMDDAGRRVGQGFVGSMATTVQRGFSGSRNNPFAAGLFGGFDRVERQAQERGERIARRIRVGAERQLAALKVPLNVGVDQGQYASARAQLDDVIKRVGAAQVAGATIRGAFADALNGVRTVGRGITQVVDGIRRDFADTGGATIRAGIGQIKTSVLTGFAALKDNLRASGIGLGQALGGAIVSGVGSALSGQQLGTATSTGGRALGLAGIVSSSLFAGAAVGGGVQGAIVGSVVASIGLISAAMADSGREAQLAAEKVRGYSDALLGIMDGESGVGQVASRVQSALLEADAGVQRLLRSAGFSLRDFSTDALAGVTQLPDVTGELARNLNVDGAAIDAFVAKLRELNVASFEDLEASKVIQVTDFDDDLRRAGISVDDFLNTIRVLFGETSAIQGAIADVDFARAINPPDVESIRRVAVESNAVRDAIDSVRESQSRSLGQQDRYVAGLEAAFNAQATGRIEDQARTFDVVRQAVERLNEARTTTIQGQIDEVSKKLDAARQFAEQARTALTNYLTGDYTGTARQAIDDLVLNIGSTGTAIAEAITAGGAVGGAGLTRALEGFQGEIQTIFNNAITSGITDLPELSALLDPVRLAISEAELPDDVKNILRGQIDSIINDENLQLAINTTMQADEEVAKQQSELDRLSVDLAANVVFDPAQIQAAARALGLTIDINAIPNFDNFTVPTLPINTPTDLVAAQVAARNVATGVGDAKDRFVTQTTNNNTVNQYNTYQTAAAEVPVVPPSEAQRQNRAAATGLLAILPNSRS